MRPSERLTLCALALLSIVTLVVRPQGGALRVLVFLGLAAATVLLTRLPGPRSVRFLRDWLPAGIVLAVFLLLQPIIEATVPWRIDAALAALDERHLPWLAAAWRNAFGRPALFTDTIYLAYVSYYLLPITVAAAAWTRSAADFERTVFALLLGFYLTFLGYLLLPASGPRLPLEEEARLMGGGLASSAVRGFLRAAETTTLDAFPSGHTAVALVAAVYGGRLLRRGAATVVWTWAAAIVFATVYINVHYVVDVIAGLVVAVVVLATCPLPSRFSASATRRRLD